MNIKKRKKRSPPVKPALYLSPGPDLDGPITRVIASLNKAFAGMKGWRKIPSTFRVKTDIVGAGTMRVYAAVSPDQWPGKIVCRFDYYVGDGWHLVTVQMRECSMRVQNHEIDGLIFDVSDMPAASEANLRAVPQDHLPISGLVASVVADPPERTHAATIQHAAAS